MALTVGELNAVLSVDDRAVSPALRRAEDAMRQTGQQMGDDAERAGQQAGEELGEGLVRGAEGRLRNARGQFVAAGRAAGDAAGDGLADGTADGADEAVDQAGGMLDRLKMLAAGAGLAAGALLMNGFTQAMEQSQITGRLGAQLGATPAEAQRYGKLAGQLYADAVTADFQTAADAISAVMRAGIAPPDATEAQLKRLATGVSDLSSTFELDLGQTANAVGQAIKTGLAKDGTEALDAFTRGMQVMGPRADDLMDTFNEYSTIFRQLGINANEATGLLSQGMKAGARDTDVVADALKEFTLITQAGGEDVEAAFKKIGMSGKDMQEVLAEGGEPARRALDMMFDRLRAVKNPADRSALALTLFGTKAEDTQKALFALDPSKATAALGQVGGAADKMGNTLRDNAGTRLEQFKRGLQQGLVEFLGGSVIPKLQQFAGFLQDHQGEIKAGAALITAVVVPALVLLGSKALWAGMQMAKAWVMGLGPIGWIGLIIGGLVVLIIYYWDEVKHYTLAAWNWVVGKLVWAKDAILAAVAYLSTIPGNVSKWFGEARAWAIQKALALVAWLQGLPGRILAAIASLGGMLSSAAGRYFQSMKDSAVKRALSLVAWVRGLPGQISRGIGSLNTLLSEKGRNVVQGLWSGIQSMGSWIKSKLISWAKSMIPDPIAKALGISSPSKVTKAQGRWIARGLVDGLTGSTKQVKAAAYKLTDIVKDALTGKRERAAVKRINKDANSLVFLAGWDAKVASQLKDAKKKLEDLRKTRQKLVDDVKKGVLDDANITKQDTGGWAQTANTILAGLKQDTAAAVTFAKNLATLRKKGVRSDLVAQIAQAGVTGGAASAAALANASGAQVKAINSQQAALVKAAGQAGTTAGDAMYGAGIQAAQGLVKGLVSHQKYIERTMLRIAKGMSKSIRKALGIKSPSRVMALVGQYTAQGLIRGVEGQRAAVNRSMASLVETPAPGSWDMASARARAAAVNRTVIEFRSSGRQADDFVMESMRRSVRKKGGGDVDLVIAGRRSG
ncbi:phage tail tape measure protein [Streptomyces sp. NPDC052013]|uniref:phage tail tape measure protein n=1 Tax=Streptomyces sp. NPDC052013 TaxID=3365679 RepID=UPI0037D87EE9